MVRIIPRLDQVKKELEEHSHRALDFNIGTISGDLRAIIAAEDKKYKAGQIKSIKIKHINIKANDMLPKCLRFKQVRSRAGGRRRNLTSNKHG